MNNQPKFKKGDRVRYELDEATIPDTTEWWATVQTKDVAPYSLTPDMLAIPDDHVWPVTPDNEVVIVDENRTENHILKDLRYAETPAQKDKFFNELTEFRKKQADQELEDAAEARYKTVPEKTKWICKDCFKHGATWQKEQSANDAIEFADWCENNYWPTAQTGKWRAEFSSEDELLTTKQLYELWQQNKKK